MNSNTVPSSESQPSDQQLVLRLLNSFMALPQGLQSVVNIKGEGAVIAVEVLNDALDSGEVDPAQRKNYTLALSKLCGRCGILPKSYNLTAGLETVSNQPHASGGFSDVWDGRYNGCRVAMKVLRTCSTDNLMKVKKRFCKEAVIWKSLSHPNILPLMGVSTSPFQFCMVSMWMTNGNINEYIKANPQANRLELLSDVTSGVSYLHAMDLVHGDLKGANILIKDDCHACLADFGLMTIISNTQDRISPVTIRNGGGTARWMAPELLNPEGFGFDHDILSKQSDVYAFGMVAFEIMTGHIPFHRCKDTSVVTKVVNGIRPEHPTNAVALGLSDDFWQIIRGCWHQQPNERPPIDVVFDFLTNAALCWDPSSSATSLNSDTDDDSDDSTNYGDTQSHILHSRQTEDTISTTTKSVSWSYTHSTLSPSLRTTPSIEVVRPRTPGPSSDRKQQSTRKRSILQRCFSISKRPQKGTEDTRSNKSQKEMMIAQDETRSSPTSDDFPHVGSSGQSDKLENRDEVLSQPLVDNGGPITLANDFVHHFRKTHELEDLEKAIARYRKNLVKPPPGLRSSLLNNLAVALTDHFKRTHKLEDLNEAVTHLLEALVIRCPGHKQRPMSLRNIAAALLDRYGRTRDFQDLKKAIIYTREAMDLLPVTHPDHVYSLNSLARAFHYRFERSNNLEDLEEAMRYSHEALDLSPPGHFARCLSLNNVVRAICSRFERSQNLDELRKALTYSREALELRPPGHVFWFDSLINLAVAIIARFEQTGRAEDLNEALKLISDAEAVLPVEPALNIRDTLSSLRQTIDKLHMASSL